MHGQHASARVDGEARRNLCRALGMAVLGSLMVIAAASSDAQRAPKQVLMLQSLHRGNLVLDQFIGDFRVQVDERVGESVNVVPMVVGPTGFVGAPNQAAVDYIRSLYADRPPPDLVMSVGGPAAAFVRQYRRQLFPEAPLLFASVDERYLRNTPLTDNETAVAVVNDFPRLIDDILQVLPETKQVFMIVGSGSLGQFWRRVLEGEFTRFRDRLTFIWSDDLSLTDILGRVASLPSHSAIVYLTFGTDALGGAYADEQVLASLHAAAKAPMFGAFTPLFGHGIVGGSLMSISGLARKTADVASQILKGAPPSTLRTQAQSPGEPTFDWRELERWGIPESRLPGGSVVQFRSPSLWAEYKRVVLAAVAALIFQSLLIAWLLYERRARQRAEIDSRRNLTLAADADRRQTIAALTSSIAHELKQPLSSILHNAQALQIAAERTASPPGPAAEILADIKAEAVLAAQIIDRHRIWLRTRQIQKTSVDIHSVISDSLAVVAHDLAIRQIETRLDSSSSACIVSGDPVLLVQVLVNLLRNAVDALAETPPGSRRITIGSKVNTADVEVSVHDTGAGLSAELLDNLFSPFVTTKPHGLGIGLAITQGIVQAHDGTITAQNNPDAGATFTVVLPRHATPRSESSPVIHALDSGLTTGRSS
jgi:signal transduction histidine kinase